MCRDLVASLNRSELVGAILVAQEQRSSGIAELHPRAEEKVAYISKTLPTFEGAKQHAAETQLKDPESLARRIQDSYWEWERNRNVLYKPDTGLIVWVLALPLILFWKWSKWRGKDLVTTKACDTIFTDHPTTVWIGLGLWALVVAFVMAVLSLTGVL